MARTGDPKRLWRRYLLALGLVVALLTGSHVASVSTMSGGQEASTVINVSGRQRMLSQRILYFASRDMLMANFAAPDSRLEDAIDLFAASHFNLTYGGGMGLSSGGATARQRYYAAPDPDGVNLHRLTVDFIADARLVANGNPAQRRAAWDRMQQVGPDVLSKRLDDAVTAFEGMAHARTARMDWIARASFVLALLVLAAEALFIFLPAQRTVNAAVARMQGAIDRLQEATAEIAENLRQAELARARAEDAERAKDRFLSHMSHELRTPLNGMVGMLDLAADSPPDEARERIATAQDAARHLVAISDDVLDLAKLGAAKLELKRRPLCPRNPGRAALAVFEAQARAKGIALVLIEGTKLPARILGDETRLRQVIFNLTSNAVKFTETGTVEIHLAHAEGHLRIEVRDTGPGIPDAQRQRLFRSFEQLDTAVTRSHGGTGLGLAISRQLVELMGGRIAIRDNPEGGSIFAVELPAETAPEAMPPRDEAPAAGVEEGSPLAGLRALVADDNKVNQMVLDGMLDRLGIAVEIVDNGAEAVAAAAVRDFDIVLMDLQMPVLDGIAAARRIRAMTGQRAAVPILAVTASTCAEDARKCDRAGFDGALSKPIRLADLERSIAARCRPQSIRARPAA